MVAVAIPSITCPTCGMVSYNTNDIAEGYCAACRAFHDTLEPADPRIISCARRLREIVAAEFFAHMSQEVAMTISADLVAAMDTASVP